jgi:hypothetical protein
MRSSYIFPGSAPFLQRHEAISAMTKHFTEEEIRLLLERFLAQQLPKTEWTHQAHLVVAVWYCRKYNEREALNLVRENIQKHNAAVGTPNTDTEGYHETITRFWLWTARQFLQRKPSFSLAEACNTFIESEFGKRTYPLRFYSRELLFSVEARRHWVPPDLHALDDLLPPAAHS